eukprot:scaffold15799_cov28-Tisochrysis_lutea.AAC.6
MTSDVPFVTSSVGSSGLKRTDVWVSTGSSSVPTCAEKSGASPPASRSQTESTCGPGPAERVAKYRASGVRSSVATPCGWGEWIDLIGLAE